MNKKVIFFVLIIFVTIFFSVVAFEPAEVVIIGPKFHEQEYFEEELNLISNDLDIKIKYQAVPDPETYLIENTNNHSSIAIIPNPQGVINLAERNLIYNLNDIYVDETRLNNLYTSHLTSIVTHEDSIYAGWTRLFPNSLIWYDISKLEETNITFDNFENLLLQTKQIADEGSAPWCANSESGASTGWIQTNWLEDILLTKYGGDIYDQWSKLEIRASNVKIYSSLKVIEELIFYENHVFDGVQAVRNNEFYSIPNLMLDDTKSCFLSWNGHYLKYYIPDNYKYLRDYGVTSVPPINFENSIVGIGDNVVLTKNDDLSKEVVSAILSSNFGETWSSYMDSEFISANKFFDKNKITNELTKYEFEIIHSAMNIDNFRYDASELMPRPVGAKYLWQFFFQYIAAGGDALVQLLNDLDKKF